jgi:Gpi18-like mannosyltransferase
MNRFTEASTKELPTPEDIDTRSGLLNNRKVPGYLLQIFTLFLITRVVLTIIGVFSRIILGRTTGFRLEWQHPQALWLDIWGQWDTGWYLDIAHNWYSSAPRMDQLLNINFFPLYPTLMKGFGIIIGNNFVAGIIISNFCLFGAAVFLHRLVLLDHDEATAMRSVKYLLIWPTSFVLSGILSEGLFLFLLITTFYSARKERWLQAGILGFLLCLTRPNGILMFLPLLYLYMQERDFRPKAIRADIFTLMLLPAGLAVFVIFNYNLTGDPFAFVHSQSAFGRSFANPLMTLFNAFTESMDDFSAWFIMATIALLAAGAKKLQFYYLLLCILFVGIALVTGLLSMPRFTAVLFPLFILLAQFGKKEEVDQGATVFLATMQGFLMVFWSTGSYLII